MKVRVRWTKDATAMPPVVQGAAEGVVGGSAKVHVSFERPTGFVSATLKELRIQEVAGHVSDSVSADLSMSAPSDPVCGDPDPADPNSPARSYADVDWPTWSGHNGSHRVIAKVEYRLVTGYTQDMQPIIETREATDTITVDVRNLLVTATSPLNPQAIGWEPTELTSTAVSCSFTCGYRAAGRARLEIFTSTQGLVRTLSKSIFTDGGSVSFAWDGKDESAVVQPRGVYLFRFRVYSPPEVDTQDADEDKTPCLTVSATATETHVVSSDETQTVHDVTYTLTSVESRPAYAGKIDVYDPLGDVVATQALTAEERLPGTHTVRVTVPRERVPGNYVFLVCVQDDHPDLDRGHRRREALQHNQGNTVFPCAVFGFKFNEAAVRAQWQNIIQKGFYRRDGRVDIPTKQYITKTYAQDQW